MNKKGILAGCSTLSRECFAEALAPWQNHVNEHGWMSSISFREYWSILASAAGVACAALLVMAYSLYVSLRGCPDEYRSGSAWECVIMYFSMLAYISIPCMVVWIPLRVYSDWWIGFLAPVDQKTIAFGVSLGAVIALLISAVTGWVIVGDILFKAICKNIAAMIVVLITGVIARILTIEAAFGFISDSDISIVFIELAFVIVVAMYAAWRWDNIRKEFPECVPCR